MLALDILAATAAAAGAVAGSTLPAAEGRSVGMVVQRKDLAPVPATAALHIPLLVLWADARYHIPSECLDMLLKCLRRGCLPRRATRGL